MHPGDFRGLSEKELDAMKASAEHHSQPVPTNQDQFDKVMSETIDRCVNILTKKGPDYAGNHDRYSNFRLVADLVGITPYQVWAVFACKQFLGELSAIKNDPWFPVTQGEPFEERVHDTINYQFLLKGMREEDARDQGIKERG